MRDPDDHPGVTPPLVRRVPGTNLPAAAIPEPSGPTIDAGGVRIDDDPAIIDRLITRLEDLET